MPRKAKKQDVPSAIAVLVAALVDERREAYHNLVDASEIAESCYKTAAALRKELNCQPSASEGKGKGKAKQEPKQGEDIESKLHTAEQSFNEWKQKAESARQAYEKVNDLLHRVYDIDRDYTSGTEFTKLFR